MQNDTKPHCKKCGAVIFKNKNGKWVHTELKMSEPNHKPEGE